MEWNMPKFCLWEMLKASGAGLVKAIAEKKNGNFNFICQYFNCSVNRIFEANWQSMKICLL